MAWDPVGLNEAVQQAAATIKESLTEITTIVRDAENRLGGMEESILDRVNGAKLKVVDGGFQIELTPIPKATAANVQGG